MEERRYSRGGDCGSNLFLCISGSGCLEWEDAVCTPAQMKTSVCGFWAGLRFCQLKCQPSFMFPYSSSDSYTPCPQLHHSRLCSGSQRTVNQFYFQTLLISTSTEKATRGATHCHNPTIPSSAIKIPPRHSSLDVGLHSVICCGNFQTQLCFQYMLFALDFSGGRADGFHGESENQRYHL